MSDQKGDQEKAKEYASLNYWFILINFLYTLAFLILFMVSGASRGLAEIASFPGQPESIGWALYLIGFIVLMSLALWPLNFYQGFIIEHRFSLSNETIGGWFTDQIKTLALMTAIFVPVGIFAYLLLSTAGTYWWIYGAAGWIAFTFILAYLAPVVIMPMFNKFEPLDSPQMKTAIFELADKAGVGITDVLKTDMSRRTKKANAFFAGAGNTRRIVLGDTLLDNYSQDEILTVVGHEMGHWKLSHLMKSMAANAVLTIVGFLGADLFLKASFTRAGLSGIDDIAGLPLIIITFIVLGFIVMPLMNSLSRFFEYQADSFELSLLGKPAATISTFEKMGGQNLADPDPHPLIELALFSHPPIKSRIALAREYKLKRDF